jgi:uncharacterized protein (DUF302 family)
MTQSMRVTHVSFTAADRASQPFQRSLLVSGTVDDAVALLRNAIEAEGVWVLHEINPQMLLARGGYAIDAARQILFFHPDLMARLLTADSAALIEAPLKFALTQAGAGQVMIRWSDAAAAFARYGNEDLAQLGRDLVALTDRILADLPVV